MKQYRTVVAAAAAIILLLLFPAAAAQGVLTGLSLAAKKALPALFPFLVSCNFFAASGAPVLLARPLSAPLRTLYHLPSQAGSALLLGFLGGYPIGAVSTAALLSQEAITPAQAEYLVLFCNCASPAFCVGLCGTMLCGSAKTGWLLYGLHITAALLTGLLFRPPEHAPEHAFPAASPPPAPAPAFVSAVQQAARTAVQISAFITVFSVILCALAPVLRLFGAFSAIPSALLELTCGLSKLPALPRMLRLPLTSFLLGFGGLSVHCQVRAALLPYPVSLRRFLPAKLLHGFLAALLTLAVQSLHPAAIPAFRQTSIQMPADNRAAFCAIFLLFFLLCTGKSRKDTI